MNPTSLSMIPSGSKPVVTAARATLVFQDSLLGGAHQTVHARDVEVHVTPYAQYQAAVLVSFVAKGTRRRACWVGSYRPSLVVLDGWVEPRVPDTYAAPVESAPGVTVQRGRALSHSSQWTHEAAAAVTACGAKVLGDYRAHDTGDTFKAA